MRWIEGWVNEVWLGVIGGDALYWAVREVSLEDVYRGGLVTVGPNAHAAEQTGRDPTGAEEKLQGINTGEMHCRDRVATG